MIKPCGWLWIVVPGAKKWSGKRDSNPRPSAWKADALATELFPLTAVPMLVIINVEGEGFEPSKAKPADLQSAPFGHSGTPPRGAAQVRFCWSWRRDSNPQPPHYK